MRCYICDSVLSTPVWNSLYKAYEPCPTCMDIIHHVFEDTPEQPPSEDEENVPEDFSCEEIASSGDTPSGFNGAEQGLAQ